MECVDLKKAFGDRYKVAWDEAYKAEHGKGARTNDPWLRIIPCKYGHIYPHGGETLAACTNRRGKIAQNLLKLDGVQPYTDGDDGVTVLFHVDDFKRVAELMQPRRKRRMSDVQRARLAEAGKATRIRGVRSKMASQGCVPSVGVDSFPVPAC